jgi:hypothetical protein
MSGSGETRPPAFGDVRDESIFDIFASDRIRSVRQQMLAGDWPSECDACRRREDRGLESFRQVHNKKYDRYYRQLVSNPQKLVPRIRSIDLRINNVCNFKCRSCCGFSSSNWFREHNLLYPEIPMARSVYGIEDVLSFWDDFEQHIVPDLEELHLAGGEPLVCEPHYRLLEKLISSGKTDVELYYDTNLSVMRFKQWDIVELWKHFPKLKLSLSLDGVGRQGEYIRHGLNYSEWVDHVTRLDRELPHAARMMHFVVSIFNIVDLKMHIRTILDGAFVAPDRIGFTFLEWPVYLRVQVLPKFLKDRVHREVSEMIGDPISFPEPIRRQLEALLAFMTSCDLYDQHAMEFAVRTKLLDGIRGENAEEVFPYLAGMLYAAGGHSLGATSG